MPGVLFVFSTESPEMLMPVRTAYFRFVYSFASGHKLVGVVEGDRFLNAPEKVFNLRSLKAICLDPEGSQLLNFDRVFGQFSTNTPEIIFSGAHATQRSFFSFNYRGADAAVYDAVTDTWITSGWDPNNWKVEELALPVKRPAVQPLSHPLWCTWVSA